MKRACVWHLRVTEELYTEVWWGRPRKREHLDNLGVDGKIFIKIYLQQVGWGGVDWIHLAEDGDG
jgi:hypothetical protein